MLTPHIKRLANERVTACLKQIEQHFGQPLDAPSVSFNQRGKIAGSARLQSNEIRLNPVLLDDNQREFLEQVIPHEVCHIAVFQMYGRVRPHGQQWQQMMTAVFGLVPDVRHDMDVSKVGGKSFPYLCACGPVSLSVRRHNKVVRQQQQYRCRTCGETLRMAN